MVASELEVVPSGTAVFETVSTRRYTGAVKIPSSAAAEAAGDARGMGTGVIVAVIDGRIETIPYEHADVSNKEAFGVDDQVQIQIYACFANVPCRLCGRGAPAEICFSGDHGPLRADRSECRSLSTSWKIGGRYRSRTRPSVKVACACAKAAAAP